jgi:transposase
LLATNEVHNIRKRYFEKGKSIREIARETGRDRKTIRIYLEKEVRNKIHPRVVPFIKYPKLDPYKVEIDAWLTEDKLTRSKQRQSARQIYNRLAEKYGQNFTCSFRTVGGYVAKSKKELFNEKKQQEWVYGLIQGELSYEKLEKQLSSDLSSHIVRRLYHHVLKQPLKSRNKAVTILAYSNHLTQRLIAKTLFISRHSVAHYIRKFESGGIEKLFTTTQKGVMKSEDPKYVDKLFAVLHAPPSSYGVNRSTWRMEDLGRIMGENGLPISRVNIRKILKSAGYRILKAKRVLTSNDPKYKEKVEIITGILSNLKTNEKFFSIDEFGPFAVKLRGGRSWVPKGQTKTIPQWQKSKGSLLITGALELSTNQITHFYSTKKNTDEMIKLLDILLVQYADEDCIYLSWDAASWHISKKLAERVEEVNMRQCNGVHTGPTVRLVPLPSSAQFLNVIESVFSGMSKAVLHNSDYTSVEDCKKAISEHFAQRNQHFKENPKRAGNKIWGEEVTMSRFCQSNNCKDPRYR